MPSDTSRAAARLLRTVPDTTQSDNRLPGAGPLMAAAFEIGAALHDCPLSSIELVFADGWRIPLKAVHGLAALNPPARPLNESTALPPLSAKQKRILDALLGGPLKGDALAEACGLANRSSLYSGRGINGLQTSGLVINDEETGYTLTEHGEDAADAIAQG